jgi:hypothetical protein
VKHAGTEALDQIDGLLAKLRGHETLLEKQRGTFYRKGSALLHFHEDPEGMFADLKIDGEFERFRVSTVREQAAFLREVTKLLAKVSPAAPRSARSRDTRRGA